MTSELEFRLQHYKEVGPGLDWPQFLEDTQNDQALGLLGEYDRFRLLLMRMALLRQQKYFAEARELAEDLQELRHQGREQDLIILDGESVMIYLHCEQDDLMTEAALRLVHPVEDLDIWTQAYLHYTLFQLFTIIGNDAEAEREFELSHLPRHLPAEHPFAFLYNPCIGRLAYCWSLLFKEPHNMVQITEMCKKVMEESQQYWPDYNVALQSQGLHLVLQVFAGEVLSQGALEELFSDKNKSEGIVLKVALCFSSAFKYREMHKYEECNRELMHASKMLDLFYSKLEKRVLIFIVDQLVNIARKQKEEYPHTLIQFLQLQNRALNWLQQRCAVGFTALIQQARELADHQREKGHLMASLETQRYELERAHRDLIARLAHVAEYRDDQSGGHAARVGRMSARLAKQLGYSSQQARDMGYAARLHDLGKVSLPDAILLKPGLLTAQEREEMQRHTKVGAQILSGATGALQTAHDIALYHHERWDGQGYPFGLEGDEIPLPARIVAVADALDAMLTARPYRQPCSRENAIAEMRNMSGSHFDPEVIEALERVMVEMEQTLRW